LIALAPHLPPELRPKALQAVGATAHGEYRAQALMALAQPLAGRERSALLARALKVARTIEIEYLRVATLITVAAHLPAEQCRAVQVEALATMPDIGNDDLLAKALIALAPQLPPELLPKALAIGRTIPYEWDRAKTLAALAQPQSEEERLPVWTEVLAIARAIRLERDRAEAMVALAPQLPPELASEALQIGREMSSGEAQVQALAALAPHIPAEARSAVLAEAVAAIGSIAIDHDRIQAIVQLAPHLPPDLAVDALLAARAIHEATLFEPSEALVALFPSLPERERPAVIVEALSAVRRIQGGALRAGALHRLARHLPSVLPVWRQEWPATLRVIAGSNRAQCLSSLRALLPAIQAIGTDRTLPELFAAVRQVGWWWP
jgi:hypothetical protein